MRKIVIQYNRTLFSCVDWETKKKKKIPFNIEKESKSKRATATVQTNRADMIMFITAIARSLLIPIWRERLTIVNRGHGGRSTIYRTRKEKRKKRVVVIPMSHVWIGQKD